MYVKPHEISQGDTVAPGGMFASRGVVTDVTEPSHGVAAAYGALVVWVDYRNGHAPRPVTLFPEREIWHDDN